MSNRYKGGVISATPPTTTGGDTGTASGAWTLEQQMQLQAAGLWPIQPPPLFIEDVFSTWLYTGTGAAQTITNGINLSGKGGMVWMKGRNSAINGVLCDTVRSRQYYLISDAIVVQQGPSTAGRDLSTFNSNGFSLGVNENVNINANGTTMVSWTFREQPKFFDVVTYNGTGADMAVNHNLQAQPGCVMIKRLNQNSDWQVMFPGLISDGYGGTGRMSLNKTDAYSATGWTSVANSTQITIPTNTPAINEVGGTYIAYLFASNAGGFGLTESENAITCGTYTGNGSTTGPIITLGYEPQWLMIKRTNSTGSWYIFDNMRGLRNSGGVWLVANTTDPEDTSVNIISSLATGFQPVQTGTATNGGGDTYIYIAIRRGPMAVPTSGTSVFAPVAQIATGSYPRPVVTNFPVDFVIMGDRGSTWGYNWSVQDRLRGNPNVLFTSAPTAENTGALSSFASNTQFGDGWISGSASAIFECMRRAPSFMDVVCYTGTGANRTVAHNLTVTPELIIVKNRSVSDWNWAVYSSTLGGTKGLAIDLTIAEFTTSNWWNDTNPTSSVFTVGTGANTNASGNNIVAYLFATCAGVSKVGSYTGTATTKQIDCGFTGGARFVLIKRTDSTGDWYVWDSARGIVAGNDPYLLLNTTAAEVTSTDYVDTYSAGFELSSTAPAAINANGGTFIFLAIA